MITLLKIFFFIIVNLLIILLSILFITLLERKFLGILNNRKAPNFFIFNRLIQSLVDFIKLILKKNLKMNFLIKSYWIIIIFIGIIIFLCLFMNFPLNNSFVFIYINFFFFFFIYAIISFFFLILRFSSNRIFSIIALYRVLIQIISYEVGIIFLFIFPLLYINEINFYYFNINNNFILTFSLLYIIILFIVSLREINRVPFDFLERETELVSGFNVEYFSTLFRFIFLIEYGFFLFISIILNFFLTINFLMLILLLIIFIWSRSFIPRYRYDKIILLFWKDIIITILIIFIIINLI